MCENVETLPCLIGVTEKKVLCKWPELYQRQSEKTKQNKTQQNKPKTIMDLSYLFTYLF